MDKVTEMDFLVQELIAAEIIIEPVAAEVIIEPVPAEVIVGTIYYSESKTECDTELPTDTNAPISSNYIAEDRVIKSVANEDFQLEESSMNVDELITHEIDKNFELHTQGSSVDVNVNDVLVKVVDKNNHLKVSTVDKNASISQNKITEDIANAAKNCFVEKIKYRTLLKLKEMSKIEIIEWCMGMGLILTKFICSRCGCNMSLGKRSDSSDGYIWICRGYGPIHNNKNVTKSVRTGSFLASSNISLLDTLIIIHYWVYKLPREWIQLETNISISTLFQWNTFCRDVCVEICANDYNKIGGESKIVEIEGGKYRKKKNGEKMKTESFIFIGAEDMHAEKAFLRIVGKCDKNNFLELIKSSVLPGSTVISEFCSMFKCHKDKDFVNLAKSCEYKFKNPKSSKLSKRKKFWDIIRRKLPTHKKDKCSFDPFIAEFLWRKRNSCVYDKMKSFLLAILTIYPLPTSDR